ncbi:hypothetical protein L1049_017386 [Liquidambar formosana]|uniref:Bifunctional inhibitor/plant lipid transfer protein/seed storage helical domain-containing protein n=1 Tax=Liquidambar formosana TaxID=63359 RepID=A0AAP0S134_LIQFO
MTLAVPTNFPATPSPSPTIIPLLLLTSMLALASAAPPPPPPPPLPPPPSPEEEGCSTGLVAFSICLPYVSAPPNNVSSSASPQCCDLISSAFENGYAFCLCYLIREPLILGFPLNKTRILSLSSFCPLRNASSARSGSLESLCSGSNLAFLDS